MISFDMAEVERLAADLVKAAATVEVRTEKDVLTEAGRELRDRAKASAPVDTGALRDSIYLRGGAGYRDVGSDLEYARYVEFGTYKDAPQPYIYSNVAGVERDMLDALREVGIDIL